MRDNAYSRFVAWARIVLPLAAIGLLSTLFLLARTVDPAQNIPYARLKFQDLNEGQRINNPSYSGLTRDGRALAFSAEQVWADAARDDVWIGRDLALTMTNDADERLKIRAPSGTIQTSEAILDLTGGVHLEAPQGYDLQTSALTTRTDVLDLQAPGQVTVLGPGLELVAGAMHISTRPDTGGTIAVFEKGVRVLYAGQDPAQK